METLTVAPGWTTASTWTPTPTCTANQGDSNQIDGYSDACLRHTWDEQIHAVWITNVMHDAGDSRHAGEFRKQLARAELERMMAS